MSFFPCLVLFCIFPSEMEIECQPPSPSAQEDAVESERVVMEDEDFSLPVLSKVNGITVIKSMF